jgi:hypothetical protein
MLSDVTDKPVIIASDGRNVSGEVTRVAGDRTLAIGQADLTYIRIDHQVRLNSRSWRLSSSARSYSQLMTSSTDSTRKRGATIAVPQDARYEAWQVHDDHRWLVLCVPSTAGRSSGPLT